jgi:hypothetical protein
LPLGRALYIIVNDYYYTWTWPDQSHIGGMRLRDAPL